jgi:acyl carrier protein
VRHIQYSIADFVLEILRELTQDWTDLDLTEGCQLGDLGLESIALVYLIAEVQQQYGLEGKLLRRLRDAQADVRAMSVGDFAAFAADAGADVAQAQAVTA